LRLLVGCDQHWLFALYEFKVWIGNKSGAVYQGENKAFGNRVPIGGNHSPSNLILTGLVELNLQSRILTLYKSASLVDQIAIWAGNQNLRPGSAEVEKLIIEIETYQHSPSLNHRIRFGGLVNQLIVSVRR
jgi:hypothetical protein